eukprot:jgi/Botrbrau1/6607/Bobra.0189s0034.1
MKTIQRSKAMKHASRTHVRHMKRMAFLLAKVGALEERNMQLTREVEERRAVLTAETRFEKAMPGPCG